MKLKKPSNSLKLLHGLRFVLPGLHFRVLHKNLAKVRVEVNQFNEFRTEKFSDFYTIVKKQGKSLLGEKFLCIHKNLNGELLVKIIPVAQLNETLRSEISILRELDHPNIAKVLDTLIDSNSVYIISEVCKGPELFEKIISKGISSEELACNYIREILQGLAYLHSNNIIHRDIRPENLVFSDNSDSGVLKIIDLVNSIDNKGFADKIVGTSHYLAPEVFTGKFSAASDIWACGVVLYALLVGVPPFTGKTDAEVRKKAVKGLPGFKEKAWAKISNHAKRVVRLMLTFDPLKRPTAQDLLSDPWVKQSLKFLDISKPMIARTFKNFKSFYSTNKLQQAIYMFMSQSVDNERIKKEAADLFTIIDKNADGKLSTEELLDSLEENGLNLSQNELRTVLAEVDANNSGFIDFNEFLAVFINKHQVLIKENLEATFALFDADGNGEITTGELKRILGQTESEWAATITEIDQNKDGKIDMKEFKNLLCSTIS